MEYKKGKIISIIKSIINDAKVKSVFLICVFVAVLNNTEQHPQLASILCIICVWYIFTTMFEMGEDVNTLKRKSGIILSDTTINASCIYLYKKGLLEVESLLETTIDYKVKKLCQDIIDAKAKIKGTTYTKDYSKPTDKLPYSIKIECQPAEEVKQVIKEYEACLEALDNYLKNKYGI
jgi:hypothetical protein